MHESLRAALLVGHALAIGAAESDVRVVSVGQAMRSSEDPVGADERSAAEGAVHRVGSERGEEGGLEGNLSHGRRGTEDDRGTRCDGGGGGG